MEGPVDTPREDVAARQPRRWPWAIFVTLIGVGCASLVFLAGMVVSLCGLFETEPCTSGEDFAVGTGIIGAVFVACASVFAPVFVIISGRKQSPGRAAAVVTLVFLIAPTAALLASVTASVGGAPGWSAGLALLAVAAVAAGWYLSATRLTSPPDSADLSDTVDEGC